MLNIHIQHAGKNSREQTAKKESTEFLPYLFDVLVIFSKLLGEKKLLEKSRREHAELEARRSSVPALLFICSLTLNTVIFSEPQFPNL